jgi:hypothetical protein
MTPLKEESEAALLALAENTIAPFASGYVDWILRRATEQRIETLHFLSRDAQILHHIAKQRAPDHIRCNYLHLSRYALQLATLTPSTPIHSLDGLISGRTAQYLCDWLQIDPIEYESTLENSGINMAQLNVELPWSAYSQLYTNFVNEKNVEFLKLIRQRQDILVQYLIQEGLADGSRNALVDSGWNGTIQGIISGKLLQGIMPYKGIQGYYFGINKPIKHAEGWVYGDRRKYHWLRPYPEPIEMLLLADHGTVIGYKNEGGLIKAQHSNTVRHDSAIVSILHNRVVNCARQLRSVSKKESLKQLRRFVHYPSREEICVFERLSSQLKFSTPKFHRPIAKQINFFNVFAAARERIETGQEYPWPQASIINSYNNRWIVGFLLWIIYLGDLLESLKVGKRIFYSHIEKQMTTPHEKRSKSDQDVVH